MAPKAYPTLPGGKPLDAQLRRDLERHLAGRELKKRLTVERMMARFETMSKLAFSFEQFAKGQKEAAREVENLFTDLRSLTNKDGGIRGYQKNLKALCRMYQYDDDSVVGKLLKEARPQAMIYQKRELDALHGLPFSRREQRRRQRALVLAHMAFGMRKGEHAGMDDPDLDNEANRFFIRKPEKNNPQRWLTVESEVFREARPLEAWRDHRPIPKDDPNALWTYTDENDVVRRCTPTMLYDDLRAAGLEVGVRANFVRGRHTRGTALIENGKKLPYVAMFLGHKGWQVLIRYVELVDAELSDHLQGAKWLRASPRPNKTAPGESAAA